MITGCASIDVSQTRFASAVAPLAFKVRIADVKCVSVWAHSDTGAIEQESSITTGAVVGTVDAGSALR